jgi:ligand-binding sensor domain-containing protein
MKLKLSSTFFILLNSLVVLAQPPGNKVTSVFADEYGCVWFGTDHGLVRKCGEKWNAYPLQADNPGKVNDIFGSVAAEGPALWIATQEGVARLDYSSRKAGGLSFYNASATGFPADEILKLAGDESGTLFFTTGAGIGIFSSGEWSFIDDVMDIFENQFYSIAVRNDTILLGTIGEGVGRLIGSVDGYSGASCLSAPWSALAGNNVTCIFIDSRGHRWYGSDNGLSRHSSAESKEGWDDSYTRILPDPYVTSIAEDPKGNIWVGTHNGIARIGKEKSDSKIWTEREGLPGARINDICFDANESLWIATDNGVAKFNGTVFATFQPAAFVKVLQKYSKITKPIKSK